MSRLPEYMTVRQIAQRWGMKGERVRTLIRNGSLEAVNFATSEETRPCLKVSRDAVLGFERRRTVQPPPKPKRKLRTPSHVIEFFK